MKNFLSYLFISTSVFTFAQSPNYSEDIAPILYNNCTECHNTGGIAPFSLMNYQEASSIAPQLVLSVISGKMPPWPVDTNYQRYAHERILSASEINKIINWNNNGTPEGDPNLAPPIPTYVVGTKIPITPDYTLELPVYASSAYNEDEYICFTETTTFANDKWVNAIEIIPGNLTTVHHVLVYIDNTNNTSTITNDCMGVDGNLIASYAPGSEPTIFPNNANLKMGIKIPAGAKITSQIHYPLGSGGTIDSTKINFFFYENGVTNIREVFNEPLLIKTNLYIPPNTSPNFTTEFPNGNNFLTKDLSIISVFPHMHLIGQEITSYAVDPTNDTIPFEKITHWDFEWQGAYNFKNLLKVPIGSKLFAKAKYNNTSSNPHNPNDPPQLITFGESTTDEMFIVFLQYTDYQQGDENLNLEDLLNVGEKEKMQFKTLNLFPNPTKNNIKVELPFLEEIAYSIIDMEGKIVQQNNISNATDISVKNLSSGNYLLSIVKDDIIYNAKFIKE